MDARLHFLLCLQDGIFDIGEVKAIVMDLKAAEASASKYKLAAAILGALVVLLLAILCGAMIYIVDAAKDTQAPPARTRSR